MTQDKYKLYKISRIQESPTSHIIFIYDELIKLLTQVIDETGIKRQKILEKIMTVIENLMLSIIEENELAITTKKFYFSLLKRVGSIMYKKDDIICTTLIDEIKTIRAIIKQ